MALHLANEILFEANFMEVITETNLPHQKRIRDVTYMSSKILTENEVLHDGCIESIIENCSLQKGRTRSSV